MTTLLDRETWISLLDAALQRSGTEMNKGWRPMAPRIMTCKATLGMDMSISCFRLQAAHDWASPSGLEMPYFASL